MTTKTNPDLDPIVSEPTGPLRLSTGQPYAIERLRTRQMFRLLKILTRGAAPIIGEMSFSFDDPEKFMTQILAVIGFAVPEAEDEAIDFLRSMVRPANVIENPLSKQDREANEQVYQDLSDALVNPDPADTITILSKIVEVEGPEMIQLGKNLAAILRVQTAAFQAKRKPSSTNDSGN